MATWGPNLPIYSQKQWDLINLAVLEVFKNAKFWKFVSKIQISKTKFTHFASFLKIFLGHNVLSTKRLALYGRVMKIDKKLRNERYLKIGRKSKIKNKPIFMTRTWYFQKFSIFSKKNPFELKFSQSCWNIPYFHVCQ